MNDNNNVQSSPNKILFKFIIPIGLVLILIAVLFALVHPFGIGAPASKTTSVSSGTTSKSYDTNSTEVAGQKKFAAVASNKEAEKLSQTLNANLKLKRINGGEEYNWDMGWQDVESMRKCSTTAFGATKIPEVKDIGFADVQKDLIRELVPVPSKPEKKNTISYPQYDLDVPLIYTNIEDMFDKGSDGKIDFNKRLNDDNVNSPLQTKLKAGAILLPISPLPGEVGNSYISGHTSNYSLTVRSISLLNHYLVTVKWVRHSTSMTVKAANYLSMSLKPKSTKMIQMYFGQTHQSEKLLSKVQYSKMSLEKA
jgi:hypothetical protein